MKLLISGDKAPAFKLKDQFDEVVQLEDFKGKKVLLSFHPLAWTGVCIDQMRALERGYDELKELGVEALGISIDPPPTKAVWAKSLGLKKLRILADFHPLGEMSKAYGNFLEDKGISGRANVLVGEDGTILWSKQYPIPELPDLDEVLEQLK